MLLILPALPADVEVRFSPQDGCQEMILDAIEKAHTRIWIAMYSFTNDTIARALVDADNRGVDVKVLMDGQQIWGRSSRADYLVEHGIPVYFETHSGLMHHKFAITDDSVVISGSYNWSNNAEYRNDENLLVIKSKEIAELFAERFLELWDNSIVWNMKPDTLLNVSPDTSTD